MPLTMLNIGETGEIKRIGGNEETRRFLNNLGFVVGAEVVVVCAQIEAEIAELDTEEEKKELEKINEKCTQLYNETLEKMDALLVENLNFKKKYKVK